MKITVVTDQPWDVPADLLVVPVAEPLMFDGQLGEIDRRSGGELRSLEAFGELSGKRFSTALASAGDLRATRILTVGVGPADEIDRETVVHRGSVGHAAPRRAVRANRRLLARRAAGVAGGLRRGRRARHDGASSRAHSTRRTIYRETVEYGAAGARGADPGRTGRRPARRSQRAAERGRIIGEGANRRPNARPTAPRTTSRRSCSPTRRARSPSSTASRSTSSGRSRRPRWAWACSWRSGGEATTRRA